MNRLAIVTLTVGLAGCSSGVSKSNPYWFFNSKPHAKTLLADSTPRGFDWIVKEYDGFTIYYERDNAYAAQTVDDLAQYVARWIARSVALVGADRYPPRLHYFLVGSRQRMRELIGVEVNGAANVANVVTGVYSNEIKGVGVHELHHCIVNTLWGYKGVTQGLHEGFAVYADEIVRSQSLHAQAKHLRDQGRLPSAGMLLKDFRFDDASYIGMGSFVKFLYETDGMKRFKRLWQDKGHDVDHVYGRTLDRLEQEWWKVLDAQNTAQVK